MESAIEHRNSLKNISLKPGSDETRVMYTRSDNEEFMKNLQNKMRGSEFEFGGNNFFYYSFNKTSIYRDI